MPRFKKTGAKKIATSVSSGGAGGRRHVARVEFVTQRLATGSTCETLSNSEILGLERLR